MPHQFMTIECKKCGELYCPVCKEECLKYSEVDIADSKKMLIREQMRRHMIKDDKKDSDE